MNKVAKYSNPSIKIREISYKDQSSTQRLKKSSKSVRNPIKVVVDMMGDDGTIRQKIINQDQPDFTGRTKLNKFKTSRSLRKIQKYEETPLPLQTFQSTKPSGLARSFVFNKFNYDNYRQFPIPKTLNSMPSKKSKVKNNNQKNIEIVFCQNKFPDFIQKTNSKIEDIYQKEQLKQEEYHKTLLKTSVNHNKMLDRILIPKRTQRTSLSNCLKQYATLEKLSIFMQNDQQRRQRCLCYEMQKDPSRTLLLDIITHRFQFLKTMSKRVRSHLYYSLLGRQVDTLTKINVHEYMKISSMFVGKDATNQQVAIFMFIFLFGDKQPEFYLARQKLEQLNGHIHKLRIILEELYSMIEQISSELLVDALSKKQKLLRLFIDYVIDRQ